MTLPPALPHNIGMGKLALVFAVCAALAGCGDQSDEVLPDAPLGIDAMVVVVPDATVADAMTLDAAVADATVADAMPIDAMTCPDLTGEFNSVSVTSCPGHDDQAAQFIAVGTATCTIDFSSTPIKGQPFLNSGDIAIDSSGNFTGATITFGTTDETGCDGVWTSATSQLTITCTSGCTATITRI